MEPSKRWRNHHLHRLALNANNTEPSQPETATSSSTTTATLKSVTEPAVPGSVSSSPSVFEDNGVKKGKLVVYFYQDDDRQNDGNIDDGGEEELTDFWRVWRGVNFVGENVEGENG
ncbi:hypothetical protein OIU76_009526 [Salix suchowensis]|nr:hypothetical protein OIU76_009526 [Salix suchowensis]